MLLAFDRALDPRCGIERQGIAFDRASVRNYDHDGRLHVGASNISKAAVNEYIGREIPDWEQLNLDPDKRYRLFRDPEELRKATPSFNNLPLLSRHVPVTAENHQPELVIGSTGTDASFGDPFLQNSLVVWAREYINAIEAETQKELSSAYRYRADMTPGTYEGQAYDGVMRDIVGNHVALVKEGRAGPDVVVGDEKPAPLNMKDQFDMPKAKFSRGAAAAHAALAIYLRPKLAQDAKIDLGSVLTKITSTNFKASSPAIITALKKQTEGKLAQDASIDDVAEVIEALAEILPAEVPEIVEEMGGAEKDAAAADDDDAELRAMLKAKGLSDDEINKICAGTVAAMDDDDDKKDMVSKTAMDSAIAAAVKGATATAIAEATKTQSDIRDAERFVRPWVGDLTVAHDSATGVYRTALKTIGVDGLDADLPANALLAVLKAQPKPGEATRHASITARQPAMDQAGTKTYGDMFPGAAHIGRA